MDLSQIAEWVSVRDEGKWRWQWGSWLSTAHEFLEERPWTPQIVGGQLCFSAKDNSKWRVVWGSHVGRLYDDAYDTEEFQGQPLYIAHEGCQYFLVHGQRESQRFLEQIGFSVEGEVITIYPFVKSWLRSSEYVEPVWQKMIE